LTPLPPARRYTSTFHPNQQTTVSGPAEYEDFFVGDDPQREPVGAGLADLVQLEERGAGHQPVLAQPDQEGGVAFIQQQAGRLGHLGELSGEVDEVVAVAVGAGGQDQQPVGSQQVLAAGQDLLEGLEQGGLVDPAEVGWVGGVGVVELGHAPAGAGGDLAMDAPAIRW
jgi:hypothetical protein